MQMRFIFWAVWFGFLSLTVSIEATAMSDAEIRKSVEGVIAQIHPKEAPSWWQALGPNAPSVLIQMHGETTHVYRRMRLLQALAWFDDPQATEFLKDQAASTDNSVVRSAAIKTLGVSQGTKELETLEKYLKHSDPETRAAAALALQKITLSSDAGGSASESSPAAMARAHRLLQEFSATEKTGWVLSRLESARKKAEPQASDKNQKEIWRGVHIELSGSAQKFPASKSVKVEISQIQKNKDGIEVLAKFPGKTVWQSMSGKLDAANGVLKLESSTPWSLWVLKK